MEQNERSEDHGTTAPPAEEQKPAEQQVTDQGDGATQGAEETKEPVGAEG